MNDRRGFTLVELIVVAVLGSMIIGATLQVLIVNQRTYTAQAATISGQQSTRMALDVLFAELREASPAGGDLLAMASDSVRVRLMRKFGMVCETDYPLPLTFKVVRLGIGTNAFAANDSVFVFADNDPDISSDDRWIAAELGPVANATCPQDGSAASEIEFTGQSALFLADSVGIGAPVRSHLTYTFGTTTLLGDTYLARRDGHGTMTPIAGPILSTNGLEFVYRDAQGTVTSTAADVRQIEVIVRTGGEVMGPTGRMVRDSITAWIYTRN